MGRLSRLQNNLLTLGAVLGGLCILAVIAALLIGAKPLVFRSGSMAPAIPTGALAMSVPIEATSIRAGDVISVETVDGVRITHRVANADVSGDTATVTLKGDANPIPDAVPYVLRKSERVVAHAPLLGYAVAWLSSSAAVFAGGLFTAYLLFVAFGAPQRRRSHPETPASDDPPRAHHRVASRRSAAGHRAKDRAQRSTRTTAMAVACLSVLTGGALHTATPGHAAFLDAAPATAGFATAELTAPTLACQNTGLYNVTLTLTHAGDIADRYELRTLVPAKLWGSAAWQPGTPVSVPIAAGDTVFTFSQSTDVEFRASSSFGSWASDPALKYVRYTPELFRLPILGGLIPASLRCIA